MKRSDSIPFANRFEARASALLKRRGGTDAFVQAWLTRVRNNGFLTVKDFAALHGVDQAVVAVWLDKGWLPGAYKAGGIWHLPLELLITFRRRPKGPRRKFTAADIRAIRARFGKDTLKTLAEEYGMSESMVSRIASRERYADVD